MLKEGSSAPSFEAQDQNSKRHTLDDYRGKWLLLYFYPKDNTPGCTKEACVIRDTFDDFTKYNVAVLGVSADSVTSHSNFAQKHNLPFLLLSDPGKKILKAYQALRKKKLFGHEYEGILRVSYLINPSGKIAKVYPNVNPKQHAHEVLEDITALHSES